MADKCKICGKVIKNGWQYVVSRRDIHEFDKSWFATDWGHYAFCIECDKKVARLLEEISDGRCTGKGRQGA